MTAPREPAAPGRRQERRQAAERAAAARQAATAKRIRELVDAWPPPSGWQIEQLRYLFGFSGQAPRHDPR